MHVYMATEGSSAICSSHVWFKSTSGGAFSCISPGSEIKYLTVTEKKKKKKISPSES